MRAVLFLYNFAGTVALVVERERADNQHLVRIFGFDHRASGPDNRETDFFENVTVHSDAFTFAHHICLRLGDVHGQFHIAIVIGRSSCTKRIKKTGNISIVNLNMYENSSNAIIHKKVVLNYFDCFNTIPYTEVRDKKLVWLAQDTHTHTNQQSANFRSAVIQNVDDKKRVNNMHVYGRWVQGRIMPPINLSYS